MEPNKPTPPKVYGTDASLSWEFQLEYVRKTASMAVTRLHSMIQVADTETVGELVRALSQVQAMCMKALATDGPGAEPSDEALVRSVKK